MRRQPALVSLTIPICLSFAQLMPAQTRTTVVPQACVFYERLPPSRVNIQLEKIKPGEKITALNKTGTPQGRRWSSETLPNYVKPGPWNTTIIIGDETGPFLRITARDHASGGVRDEWLNEKLLFLQVWMGRVVSDDLILDVTTGRFLYSEQAGYDGTFESCKRPTPDAGGKRKEVEVSAHSLSR